MTEPTLEQIEKALEEATPGPWQANSTGWTVVSEHANICALHDGQDSLYWEAQGRTSGQGPPNAHLIAHSPEWLAYLLNRVKEAEARTAPVSVYEDAAYDQAERWSARAEVAEREVVALREALREAVAAWLDDADLTGKRVDDAMRAARALLNPVGTPEETATDG